MLPRPSRARRLLVVCSLFAASACGRTGYDALDGAAMFDAGNVDAGTDTGTDTDASGGTDCAAYPSALFCTGFERPFEDEGWAITAEEPITRVEWTTSDVFEGERALETTAISGGGRAVLERTFPGVGVGGDLWVRFYVRTDSLPDANTSLMSVHASGTGDRATDLNLRSDGRLAVWNPWGEDNVYGTALPVGRWTCVEFGIDVHPVDGTISIYVDSELVGERSGFRTAPNGAYSTINLGIDWMDETHPGISLGFDNLVISRTRPHCTPSMS